MPYGKAFSGTQAYSTSGNSSCASSARCRPVKVLLFHDDAGEKAFFFAVTVGHGVVHLLAAARTVGEIDAIPQMSQQRQLETS